MTPSAEDPAASAAAEDAGREAEFFCGHARLRRGRARENAARERPSHIGLYDPVKGKKKVVKFGGVGFVGVTKKNKNKNKNKY